ncbi:tenascin-X [Caerostris extrusa]|uniref:Tenascin-X n=1 Tax=Caerostris extrusa TaxID=172846 RepID=A0AAV4Y4W8_CAEEX|nr:tenascin-X [Caerostris extrusa]
MIFSSVFIYICAQILLRSRLNAKAVSIRKLPAEALAEVNYNNGDMVHILKNSSWQEPCLWNSDCQNGGTCEDQGEFKLCQCKPGVGGDKCDFVSDCFNKYSNCEGERGTCSYDLQNEKAVCTCSGNKALHPYENICKETCRTDGDCENNGICKEKGGNGFCECKPEIKGDRCEIVYDCTNGKYKNCKGENGTCSYNFDTNAAECRCPADKKLHDLENICKVSTESCREDSDCQNGGSCTAVGESKFCQCQAGVIGDRCQTVVDCDSVNYKNCKGDNGTCFYDQQKKTAVCNCRFNKTFDPSDGICKETCRDDSGCQNGGYCTIVGESKFCQCKAGVIGDRCQTVVDCISGKYKNCKGENGSCSYDQQRNTVVCHCPDNKTFNPYEGICKVKRNTTTVRTTNSPSLMTTIRMSTSSECYCGRHSYSCFYDAFLGKVCRCLYGYIQVNGSCTAIKYNTSTTERPETTSRDCDCGKNSYYCHFDWSGTKVCDCNYGYVQIDGYCTGNALEY